MSDDRLARWAAKQLGGVFNEPQKKAAPATAPGALPPPPPGYGYVWDQGRQTFLMVPMAPQANYQPPAPYAAQSYPSAPATSGYAQVIPIRQTRAQTCALVKPGDKDPYADFIAGVPELPVPQLGVGYDAMAGNMSPATREALRGVAEAPSDSPMDAYPKGAVLKSQSDMSDLK